MANKSDKHTANTAQAGGLIGWFAHNHVAANILMMLFLVGGVISVFTMRTETFPSIDPRMIAVSTAYPGATPYEVTDSITNRVEEALIGIDGVKRIVSTATEGYGVVNVELEDFANADDAYNEVETAVNALSDFPPEEAERPKIIKLKPTPNVMTLVIYGQVPEKTLKYWAETIEDELRQLQGVAKTNLRGIRDYEISIEISEKTLRNYDLSLEDISNAVNLFSLDVPAGTIESARGDILLRVQQQRYTGEQFEKIVIRTLPNGSVLTLGDIGKVIDGFEDTNLISRYNGERAAFIDVSRSDSEDTLQVANNVKEYLETVSLPKGLQLGLQKDETVNLQDRINLMMRNAILGFMLVFLVLLLFLDLKLAFWTSIAIPVSFLGGMLIIHLMGYSLNMISLFALIVVLGIVVDDAIVTGESIFTAQEREPDEPDSFLKGVYTVIAPVTIGVLTTIAAFAPLIFSTGVLGQIIRVIPVVVISILIVSLLEAYFILPAHLSKPTRWSEGIVSDIRDRFTDGLDALVDKIVLPLADFSMRWRYASLALFIGIAIITASMFQSGIIRFIFFPQVESDEVTVSVTMPTGTPFEVTEQTMTIIEGHVNDVRAELDKPNMPVFESLSLAIGQHAGDNGGPGGRTGNSNGNNLGQVKIKLLPSDLRSVSALQVESMIRERIENLPNIETLEFQSSLIGGQADVEVELAHPEEEQLNKAAEELKQQLAQIQGTTEITDSYEPGKNEYVFDLTQEGLAVGLTPLELGRQLRSAFFGLEAERFQRGRSEVIVYVRYPEEERKNIKTLSQMRIRLPNGLEVPLSRVARIHEQTGYAQIKSVNGRQIISVTSDVDKSITTPNDVIAALQTNVLPSIQERYPGLSYSFEGQSRDQAEDLASLGRNMSVALLLIYVLLGAQLRSYIQPLIIMSAIPFGVIGAVWGHYLLGHDVTFISLFGIVALTGVIVNDSVVLMDYFNRLRAQGKRSHDSALGAIKRRFRPILLTTMTTSLGLLPMLLEKSMQAQFLIPMVISLATGIIFATFVILLLVPNLVMMNDDVYRLFRKRKIQKKRKRVTHKL